MCFGSVKGKVESMNRMQQVDAAKMAKRKPRRGRWGRKLGIESRHELRLIWMRGRRARSVLPALSMRYVSTSNMLYARGGRSEVDVVAEEVGVVERLPAAAPDTRCDGRMPWYTLDDVTVESGRVGGENALELATGDAASEIVKGGEIDQ